MTRPGMRERSCLDGMVVLIQPSTIPEPVHLLSTLLVWHAISCLPPQWSGHEGVGDTPLPPRLPPGLRLPNLLAAYLGSFPSPPSGLQDTGLRDTPYPVPVPRVVRNNNTTQSSNEGKQLSCGLVLVGGTGALQRETGPVRTPRTAAGGGVFTHPPRLAPQASGDKSISSRIRRLPKDVRPVQSP